MIAVKDISTLVGKRVVSQDGQLGTIDKIMKHPSCYILVTFDGITGWNTYRENGLYYSNDSQHITLIEESSVISNIYKEITHTMTKYKLTPEELIAIILERHCP